MALRITVNGEVREIADLESMASLEAVIAGLGLAGDRVAVERNGEIASRAGWSTVAVASGDRLEIVHFVGGGCPQACPGHR